MRARFDPMTFPDVLPWLMLAEIVDHANETRPYDTMGRYIGTEIERYFAAANFTRVLLSSIGAPYSERWFRISDDSIASRQPRFYHGAPYLTGYDFIALEMLTLPLSRTGLAVDYVISAMAPLRA